jgi:hypothetical protein
LNQNYTSSSGTLYHIQIEDLGPLMDSVSETEVRRLNLIVYANYGEANARIIHGSDHDFPDVRSQEHNRFVQERIQQLTGDARAIVEEKEKRQIQRIKTLIREYYHTKSEATKKEFEAANALYPFLFSRAWMELKLARGPSAATVEAEAPPLQPTVAEAEAEAPEEVVYPLDRELRERVIEIERIVMELAHDLQQLKARGSADDILLQTCRKLVARARDAITGRAPSEFTVRRLEMTRASLVTTWKQVRSRLTRR